MVPGASSLESTAASTRARGCLLSCTWLPRALVLLLRFGPPSTMGRKPGIPVLSSGFVCGPGCQAVGTTCVRIPSPPRCSRVGRISWGPSGSGQTAGRRKMGMLGQAEQSCGSEPCQPHGYTHQRSIIRDQPPKEPSDPSQVLPCSGERRAQLRAGRGLLCTPRCRHTLAGRVERHGCQRGAGSTPRGAGRSPACPSG